MMDPVVAEDGITYERAMLDLWMQTSRPLSSPITRQQLTPGVYFPNRALQSVIREFVEERVQLRNQLA